MHATAHEMLACLWEVPGLPHEDPSLVGRVPWGAMVLLCGPGVLTNLEAIDRRKDLMSAPCRGVRELPGEFWSQIQH